MQTQGPGLSFIRYFLLFASLSFLPGSLAATTLSFDSVDFDTPFLPALGPSGLNVGDMTLVEIVLTGINDASGLNSFQLALKYDPSQWLLMASGFGLLTSIRPNTQSQLK